MEGATSLLSNMSLDADRDIDTSYEKSRLEKLTQQQLINVYESVIIEYISPSQLIEVMVGFFDDTAERQTILYEERAKGSSKAARLFLDHLRKENKPGWYEAFIASLKTKEYKYLAKCLESGDTEMDQEVYRMVLRDCRPILHKVNPVPLLPALIAKRCIVNEEAEEVRNVAQGETDTMANFILLDRVVSHKEDWFNILVKALVDCGYDIIANKLLCRLNDNSTELTKEAIDHILKRTGESIERNRLFQQSEEVIVNGLSQTNNGNAAVHNLEDMDVPLPKELELRPYQVQQARAAMLGKNVIIVAPTGSGKTFVAMGIAKHHFKESDREEKPKVLFVVPTVPLVEQQYRRLKTYFSDKEVMKLSGDVTQQTRMNVPLNLTFDKNDIVVLTPQILINALATENVKSIGYFSLIILDECHHTGKEHPYALMMKNYLLEKQISAGGLPQIVGLTASVGVDKANTEERAQENIMKLCARLDVEKISLGDVTMTHHNSIEEEAEETSDRTHDPFKNRITEAMIQIERKMFGIPELQSTPELVNFHSSHNTPPQDRATQIYGNNWLTSLPVDQIADANVRRVLVACTKHLKVYHRGLVLASGCMAQDALEYISKELTEIGVAPDHELDNWLQSLFADMQNELKGYCKTDQNPKLEALKHKILEHRRTNPSLRVIVFCMRRELTRALCRWMERDPILGDLNPDYIVGGANAHASSDRAGMTQTMQDDVLKKFDAGHVKILVSTSVCQEGIDIKDCDYVIMYGYITSDIGRVQSKGRVRAENGKYTAFGEEGGGTTQREQVNRMREQLMNDVLEKIQDMPPDEFKAMIDRHQKELLVGWRRQERMQEGNRSVPQDIRRGYRLECLECGEFACTLADVKKVKGMYHFVMDRDFDQRIYTTAHPDENQYDPDIQQTRKMYCKKCQLKCDWGNQVIYKDTLFSVIKIVAFIVKDPSGKSRNYKKWNKVPLKPLDLSDDELEKYIDWRLTALTT